MKILIFLSLFISNLAYAGTCTTIERTNYSANQILTSTSLNAQLNAIYAPFNNASGAADGGCIADGTLEDGALNATDFAAMLNGIQRGCKVEYSDANTVTISKCFASVNGNLVAKSSATSLTWGCTDCSSETATTTYYVYIKTGSSGSTINGLISTTAPNADGYDNSGNLVLARFYNNASSAIDQYSIDQWLINRFVPTNTAWTSYTPTFTGFGTVANTDFKWKREGSQILIKGRTQSGTVTAVSPKVTLPSLTFNIANETYLIHAGMAYVNASSGAGFLNNAPVYLGTGGDNVMYFQNNATISNEVETDATNIFSNSGNWTMHAKFAVNGWGD